MPTLTSTGRKNGRPYARPARLQHLRDSYVQLIGVDRLTSEPLLASRIQAAVELRILADDLRAKVTRHGATVDEAQTVVNLEAAAERAERRLALQLPICFKVRALSGGLVSSTPE
jgi:hypothetical protein